ncbi:MAG: methyltransferase domain-containing protein [Anaerolineales bacterium]|nr:methyltransferase domain-containing protein [Anaerolineales bacterium]
MKHTKSELAENLQLEAYPRSAGYDLEWVLENQMGPNVLWLAESLSQKIDLAPNMRVLDMGCGKAISSIFLAKEFGVQVWATDLWVKPTENWQRIKEAEVEDRVYPIHAEAHDLPYADEFFDALISLDAYHYFGTDDLYLGWYYSKLVKPGGQIGIVVPGLVNEFDRGLPDHLQPFWDWELWSFHNPDWWRTHWEKSAKVTVDLADMIPDGWQQWLLWEETKINRGISDFPEEANMLRVDAGRNLGFVRMVARRKG